MFGSQDVIGIFDPNTNTYETLGSGFSSPGDVYDYIEENYPAGSGRESVQIVIEVEKYP